MSFNDIPGNARVKKILKKGLARERIPNALLFVGPEGVGKRETALVLAKAMSCLNLTDDSCEECAHCKAINQGNFPDVMRIAPEKDIIKIKTMREMKQAAYLKPMVGEKRVFIIQEAEKMKEEGANSLLKILEEPPLFSHLILTSRNPFLILPTIKSRSQVLTFSSISREDIEKELRDKGYDKQKAELLSVMARGNLNQALDLDWDDVQAKKKRAWEIFQAFAREENAGDMLKELSSSGTGFRGELSQILEILTTFFRDLLLIGSGADRSMLLNPDYEDALGEAAKYFGADASMAFIQRLETAHYALQKMGNVNVVVSLLFSDFGGKKGQRSERRQPLGGEG